MAGYRAVEAIGKTIIELLTTRAEELRELGRPTFQLYGSQELRTKPIKLGASLYLYRVTVDRPLLGLGLHYLLTFWAPQPDLQHVLLGWAVRTLAARTFLGAAALNAHAPGTFADVESVTLVNEPISIVDMASVLEATKPELQLSVGYLAVTSLTLDEAREEAGPPVQERLFEPAGADDRRRAR